MLQNIYKTQSNTKLYYITVTIEMRNLRDNMAVYMKTHSQYYDLKFYLKVDCLSSKLLRRIY